jgi:hypothetical protein
MNHSNTGARVGGAGQPLMVVSRYQYRSTRGSLATCSRISSWLRVLGGVGLAEGLGVAADQIGQDQTGLLGCWVDPAGQRRLDPLSDLVGQLVVQPRPVAVGPLGRLGFGRPADARLEVRVLD